ncbi:MAG: DNA topoisomerase VI subunit B [Bdellovibrionota bacterium]
MTKSSTKAISTSSTAEYFAKNLQQVGFSSPTKAVLTTLKEAVDNALDACEEHGILPELNVYIEKLGKGNLRNTDRIKIRVTDNGPGIRLEDIPKVFGEYLASSKFGRGRCSRGQQGIGISAATTWAIQTTATGAHVISKRKGQKKAIKCTVATDLKKNKGIIQKKEQIDWEQPHGTSVEFVIDGRVQLNGEAGLLNYLRGNILLNPHLTLTYELPEINKTTLERVSTTLPQVPAATAPHPHTMKLGEFMSHGRLFGRTSVRDWLKKGFSRVSDKIIAEILTNGKIAKDILNKQVGTLKNEDFTKLFKGVQETNLMAPPTSSVMSVGEEGLALSIQRLGEVDYFSVVSRKPIICDFKPVQIEVAIARSQERTGESETAVQVLRFANRVPLQFDKASCAIVKAITSINWKSYGIRQAKGQMPMGPYVIAVSVVSPFIKFKNASKETIDASDDLVEEIRRGLMKAGQRLSRHLKREHKADELEQKIRHIEKFCPILVETLCRILKAPESRKEKAELGLRKILGRETKETEKQLSTAEQKLQDHLEVQKQRFSSFKEEDQSLLELENDDENAADKNNEENTSATEESTIDKNKTKATKKEVIQKSKKVKKDTDNSKKKTKTSKKSTKKTSAKKAVKKKTIKKKATTKKKTTKKKVAATKAVKKKTTKKKATTKKKTAKKKASNKKATKKKK